ncbi:MAG: hypothetical protein EOO39_37590 [Cytophagaceae bacterium]|nr:MAG: hypothetical protein EOO39_37590 [Cytophagaceae bacterium]
MLSLADTTDYLDQTTKSLTGEVGKLTPQTGIVQLDLWIEPLKAAQNTQPLAAELSKLKTLLQATPVDRVAVQMQMGTLAEQLSLMSADMGGEGEMPALMDGLSASLRQAGDTSKAD